MNAVVPLPIVPPPEIKQSPGRLALGWLPEAEISANIGAPQGTPAFVMAKARWDNAKQVIAARAALDESSSATSEPPEALGQYIAELGQDPGVIPMLRDGWSVKLVDLRQVRGFQKQVFLSAADSKTAGLMDGDLTRLAEVTIPKTSMQPVMIQGFPASNSFAITAQDFNLRIGPMQQVPAPDGSIIIGFSFFTGASRLCVYQLGNKCILNDGYHRAIGLLRQGIYIVPAMVHKVEKGEPFQIPNGMLPLGDVLGERPLLLKDYLDDKVSMEITMNEMYKMLVVHALEMTPNQYA